MKRILAFISFIIMFTSLVGCGATKHSDELADYYNSYVSTMNPLGEKIDEQAEKIAMIQDDQEALDFHKETIVPLVEEVEEYITSLDPKSEVVQELHEMRLKQINAWFNGFELLTEAYEVAAESGDEEKINKLVQQSDAKFYEANQLAVMADQRFLQLASEHNVKLVEE